MTKAVRVEALAFYTEGPAPGWTIWALTGSAWQRYAYTQLSEEDAKRLTRKTSNRLRRHYQTAGSVPNVAHDT